MKKLFTANSLLLASFLVLLAGSMFIFLYMVRPRPHYSFDETLSEDKIISLVILLTGLFSAGLNLVAVYKTFMDQIRVRTFLKLVFLNFPLMVLGSLLLYGWLVVNAVF